MRNRMSFLPVLALTMASTAVAQRPSSEAAIRHLDSLWARMYQVHDTSTAQKLYADHLVFTSANGQNKTKAQELADVRPYPGLVMDYFRTRPDSVQTVGDSARVFGIAEWRFTMNGRANDVKRTYAHLYARGGPLGWQLVQVRMGNAP